MGPEAFDNLDLVHLPFRSFLLLKRKGGALGGSASTLGRILWLNLCLLLTFT